MKNKSIKDEDFILIIKIKKGDVTAYRQLIEKYKNVSLSLATSIMKNQNKAEDVLQDAFIRMFKAIDTFNFKSKFSTWLYRIVVNTSYNALKKEKININIDDIESDTIVDSDTIGIDAINKEDQIKYIKIAINRLRPDEALVLRLFYLCELSINEINEVTNFTTDKIKVDLYRGRDNMYYHLRKILGDEIKQIL